MDYLIETLAKRILGDIGWSSSPGSVMKKWREAFQISQGELARYLGITQSVIADYERGRRNPGVEFLRKYVRALIEIDASRGYKVINELLKGYTLMLPYIDDLGDFSVPVGVDEIVTAVNGFIPNSFIPEVKIYGWMVTDSVKAITSLKGMEFYQLLNFMIGRAVVFTNVSSGRSPMIALKIAPIKPPLVVFHRPVRLDPLALLLAEKDNIVIVVSTFTKAEDITKRIRSLAQSVKV
ncbi:helix-turn-helix domain-containing protein [Sulfurisphaera ohwakuensis]|uniref:helix-turn-helix domain-containing protein n=1 Tax=Sulfurisphaera ohwakuensis TaxID=69656 RepID=UPI0036F28694